MRLAAFLAFLLATAVAPAQGPTTALERRVERGPVTALVRLDPGTIAIGDTITLTLEVRAETGVELYMPEFGESLARFNILDFVPATRIEDDGATLATHRYRLQPLRSGEHAVPPIPIEFVDRRPGQRPAPEDEDAYEVLTERLAFTVKTVLPDAAGAELHPALGPIAQPPSAVAARAGEIAAWLAVPALAALAWLLVRRARRRPPPDPYTAAQVRLRALRDRELPDASAMEAFYVELTDIVRRYVEARFGLHAPELTTEEFLDAAATSSDLDSAQRGFLQAFLQSADRVKFARHVPTRETALGALDAVASFLASTRAGPAAAAGAAASTGEPAHA